MFDILAKSIPMSGSLTVMLDISLKRWSMSTSAVLMKATTRDAGGHMY